MTLNFREELYGSIPNNHHTPDNSALHRVQKWSFLLTVKCTSFSLFGRFWNLAIMTPLLASQRAVRLRRDERSSITRYWHPLVVNGTHYTQVKSRNFSHLINKNKFRIENKSQILYNSWLLNNLNWETSKKQTNKTKQATN